jgi:glutamate synthase domain-containing protein 2
MPSIRLAFSPRYIILTMCGLAAVACVVLVLARPQLRGAIALPLVASFGLTALGVRDLRQTRHSILRNYPVIGHLRFLLEEIRPEMRQYFFEDDTDSRPFSRDQRGIVYQRAKNVLDKRPFGTQLDVYGDAYEWINHSIAPAHVGTHDFRVTIGGPDCGRPYAASVFNISAMSFGSLSANAILALNKGARMGNFAHDTGEGGFSPHHRANGGDIIWEIGSGYFGCRNPDGTFSRERFLDTVSSEQIKMIEIKLSQGAKPGHGGVLPAPKVSAEIATTRGVPVGMDCISPSTHSAFSTPIEMMRFIAELRKLSGGRPVGFKLCVGQPWEFLGLVKAMIETGIMPDFIVVDGKEGGTGAAPLEFLDHVGMPLRDGLSFVHNALVGAGLRDRIRIGASGKIVSAFDIVRAMALGADWCNSARGFMFALGCIQSQSCHTDKCPVGVATQDPSRQRALVVPDKAERVANFHKATLRSLAELVAACGLQHPSAIRAYHISKRVEPDGIVRLDEIYPPLSHGELLNGTQDRRYKDAWRMASAHSFQGVI